MVTPAVPVDKRAFVRCCLLFLLLTALAAAQSAEQRTSLSFERARKQPQLLLAFLHDLPKGGDLHNHLDGAIYAEDLVDFAADGSLCTDRTSSRLLAPPCDPCETYTAKPAARCAYGDHVLYNQMIDAWSMRNWKSGDESGHDHFFATFDKFGLASHTHVAEAIAAATNRAGMDHLQYVELMHTADAGGAARLAEKVEWNPDYAKMRDSLLAAGMKDWLQKPASGSPLTTPALKKFSNAEHRTPLQDAASQFAISTKFSAHCRTKSSLRKFF